MRKLLACLVVLVMMLNVAPLAMASGERVTFTNFRYTDADGVGIEKPQSGLVYTEVTADYSGSEEKTVMLIVMLCDKETGKIKAADSDSASFPGEDTQAPLKAGVTVGSTSEEEYKYFLWDGVETHAPLDNVKPAAPAELSDTVNKPSSIQLDWSAAEDDFDDVASYNVYNGSVMISSGDNKTTFTQKNLDKGTVQNYFVEAVDGEGLVSDKKELSVKTAEVANIEMSDPNPESVTGVTENGVWLWLPTARPEVTGTKAGDKGGYGYTEATEAGGRACRVAPDYLRGSSTLIGRFTCKVNPEYIDAEDSSVIIDVTYFDEDTENVTISYVRNDTTPGALKYGSSTFTKTGTGLWKTSSFRLQDAAFHYYMDDGTGQGNFRFWQNTPGLKVSNVAVSRRSDYDGDPAGLRVKDVPEIRDVIFFMDQAESAVVDGVNCIEIDSAEALEFDITDTRLNGVGRVNVEIEYLDEGEGDMLVEYKTASGPSQKTIALTNSGEWKKATLEITDAKFSVGESDPVPDDLVISTQTGQPLRVKTIRVYDAR